VTTSPVYLDRLQTGLRLAVLAANPGATVVWAPSELPRAATPATVFTLRLLAGPDEDPLGGASATAASLPMAATITLADPVVGEGVLLFVSGRRFEHTFASLDIEAERDAWLVAITTDPMVNATFEASSTDAITIEADALGDLHHLAVRGDSIALDVTSRESALVQVVDVRSYVEIQAHSTNRFPRAGAAAALNRFRSATRLPSVAAALEEHGLGLIGTPGRVVSLDALAGPTWTSRSALSLYISQLSLAAEAVERIAHIRGTLVVRGAAADDTAITVDVEPPP
jgi:hypothetical protein